MNGKWTWNLIPNIETWINRKHGEVDYFLTQVLSGHGCFHQYLFKSHRADTEECMYCSGIDDVEHTLFQYPRWKDIRIRYRQGLGREFNSRNLMECLTSSEQNWKRAYRVVREIIETKERESR